MKSIFRSYLINLLAIWLTIHLITALQVSSGYKGLLEAGVVFMVANILITPFLKIILLPLNLLTLGIFAWLSNVLTLYILVSFLPIFSLEPYNFQGIALNGFTIPATQLSTFQTAIAAAFFLALFIHLFHWIIE